MRYLHAVPVKPSDRNGSSGIEPKKGYIGDLDHENCADVVAIAVSRKYTDQEAVKHFKLDRVQDRCHPFLFFVLFVWVAVCCNHVFSVEVF